MTKCPTRRVHSCGIATTGTKPTLTAAVFTDGRFFLAPERGGRYFWLRLGCGFCRTLPESAGLGC